MAGQDPDQRDDEGETALSWGAYLGYTAIVKDLLAAGSDQSLHGARFAASPFILAAGQYHRSILALLMPLADVDQVDLKQETALMAVARRPTYSAKEQDAQGQIVKLLLANSADLTCLNQDRHSALDLAQAASNHPILEQLQRALAEDQG